MSTTKLLENNIDLNSHKIPIINVFITFLNKQKYFEFKDVYQL